MTSRHGYDPRTDQLLALLTGAGITSRERALLAVALADQEGLPRPAQDQLARDLGIQIERPDDDRAHRRIEAALATLGAEYDPPAGADAALEVKLVSHLREAQLVTEELGAQLLAVALDTTDDIGAITDALVAAIVQASGRLGSPADANDLIRGAVALLRAPGPRGADEVDPAELGAEPTVPGRGKDVP